MIKSIIVFKINNYKLKKIIIPITELSSENRTYKGVHVFPLSYDRFITKSVFTWSLLEPILASPHANKSPFGNDNSEGAFITK